MHELALKSRILAYLEKHSEWINGGEIEKLAETVGYKASNASRRLRELHNEGKIIRELRKSTKGRNASVWYKANETL